VLAWTKAPTVLEAKGKPEHCEQCMTRKEGQSNKQDRTGRGHQGEVSMLLELMYVFPLLLEARRIREFGGAR